MNKQRENNLTKWLSESFSVPLEKLLLKPMLGDAGFRRYFRFTLNQTDYIAVDAPQDKSNNQAFVNVQKLLSQQGVPVPEIIHLDLAQGFLCLSDLGSTLLSDVINDDPVGYYSQAIALIPFMAKAHKKALAPLPCYDQTLLRIELSLFVDWLLAKHLSITLTQDEWIALNTAFDLLVENALNQPQVFVHRDYHSRNIMKVKQGTLAVIDFQDAVLGPITYDIVSLLRDCYVRWPAQLVDDLFESFCESMKQSEQLDLSHISKETWIQWFDLMGVQRHLKASGIFARLHYRDGKSHYLNDIPLTLSYLVDICAKYPKLQVIARLVKDKVLPALALKEATSTKEKTQ